MEEETRMIRTTDVEDFFFKHLVKAGLAPSSGDLEIISDIVFEFLIDIGIINADNVEVVDDHEDDLEK
jgi:hypothetical protein